MSVIDNPLTLGAGDTRIYITSYSLSLPFFFSCFPSPPSLARFHSHLQKVIFCFLSSFILLFIFFIFILWKEKPLHHSVFQKYLQAKDYDQTFGIQYLFFSTRRDSSGFFLPPLINTVHSHQIGSNSLERARCSHGESTRRDRHLTLS